MYRSASVSNVDSVAIIATYRQPASHASKAACVCLSAYLQSGRGDTAGADDPKVAGAIAEKRRNNEETVEHHAVVSLEEWLKQRLKIMEKEKQHMRAGGELAAEVRALPWVKVEKNYLSTAGRSDAGGPVQAASSVIH